MTDILEMIDTNANEGQAGICLKEQSKSLSP